MFGFPVARSRSGADLETAPPCVHGLPVGGFHRTPEKHVARRLDTDSAQQPSARPSPAPRMYLAEQARELFVRNVGPRRKQTWKFRRVHLQPAAPARRRMYVLNVCTHIQKARSRGPCRWFWLARVDAALPHEVTRRWRLRPKFFRHGPNALAKTAPAMRHQQAS